MSSTDANVTVYYTSWCAFCHTEMQWLDKLGVSYNKKNIEEDDSAREELLDKLKGDFKGVPVTDVAGDIILGFDRPRIQASIKEHGIAATAA